MFSVGHYAGRLIETRASSLVTVDEVAAFGARFREVTGKLAGQVVICGDYRGLRVLSPDVAEKFVAMLTAANPRIERSALLCSPDHATAALQIERTVKQSAKASRRTFRDGAELAAWLGEVLSAEESTRLLTFLRAQ
jgi:hypothetical protein